jgi:hypothetical protein
VDKRKGTHGDLEYMACGRSESCPEWLELRGAERPSEAAIVGLVCQGRTWDFTLKGS